MGQPGRTVVGLITDKLIRRGVHIGVAAPENDIRQWIDTWNENPRPFAWTKTADEILANIWRESQAEDTRPVRPEPGQRAVVAN